MSARRAVLHLLLMRAHSTIQRRGLLPGDGDGFVAQQPQPLEAIENRGLRVNLELLGQVLLADRPWPVT